MARRNPRYLRFKVAMAAGLMLGLLVLVESIVSYREVSTSLVTSELRQEAQQELAVLEAEARRQNLDPVADADQFGRLLEEMRQDTPKKIAWIQVMDGAGHILLQNGKAFGSQFPEERLRMVFEVGGAISEARDTPVGKVLVSVHSVRLPRKRGPVPPTPEPPPSQSPYPRFGQYSRFVELALYWNSASEAFVSLRTDLITDCLAAVGLVLSMVLLWSRLPDYVTGKQLEQQTELARLVQADLLPAANVSFDGLDFAAECDSAWQVGGDFYDVFSASDGRIAMVLGDVSGKGLPASVVVGLLLGAVRASNWLDGSDQHETASRKLSELLRARTSEDRFASLFWCYYEPGSHILRYVNAGHLPPMLLRCNGGGLPEVERLREGGPVLGILPNSDYRQGQAAFCPGDLLVLYSDGLVEAENSSQENFGEERLLAAVRDAAHKSAAEIRADILRRVHDFLGNEPAGDDLTIVVARIESCHGSAAAS